MRNATRNFKLSAFASTLLSSFDPVSMEIKFYGFANFLRMPKYTVGVRPKRCIGL